VHGSGATLTAVIVLGAPRQHATRPKAAARERSMPSTISWLVMVAQSGPARFMTMMMHVHVTVGQAKPETLLRWRRRLRTPNLAPHGPT
jgi:hypothetical protein